MDNLINIPAVFGEQDTVFHYTSMNTAIEYILHTKSLKLSPRLKSIDPIENLQNFISYSISGRAAENDFFKNEFEEKSAKINKSLKELIKQAKQVCFCMNPPINPSEGIHMVLPAEKYGFLKPRMWDQYGDNYRGVCLSFSKRKLIEQHDELKGEIDYIKYSELRTNHISIDSSILDKLGETAYKETLIKRLSSSFLLKHIDYSGESEYRMFSFNEYDQAFINITESLNGIIASSVSLSPFALENLRKYSNEFGVPLIFVTFNNSGVRIRTDDELRSVEALTKKILKK